MNSSVRRKLRIATACAGVLAVSARAPEPATATEAAPTLLSGMFVYLADAARLTECKSGRSYPVAMERDFPALERAYGAARQTDLQPLLVTVDARIEDRPHVDADGEEPTVVVDRFVEIWPEETCERNRADASLTETYWRLVRLGTEPVQVPVNGREPHLLLHHSPPRYEATVGCNRMAGSFQTDGTALKFGQAISTLMACPPPVDEIESRLAAALAATASGRIEGQFLEMADSDGRPTALLQAVYLR